jgi:hypothetical protein
MDHCNPAFRWIDRIGSRGRRRFRLVDRRDHGCNRAWSDLAGTRLAVGSRDWSESASHKPGQQRSTSRPAATYVVVPDRIRPLVCGRVHGRLSEQNGFSSAGKGRLEGRPDDRFLRLPGELSSRAERGTCSFSARPRVAHPFARLWRRVGISASVYEHSRVAHPFARLWRRVGIRRVAHPFARLWRRVGIRCLNRTPDISGHVFKACRSAPIIDWF